MNIDYVYDVPHFVRPGETIESSSRKTFAGGKGLNQSVALSKAGAAVFHAGSIGDGGEILLDALREAGVDCTYVYRQQAQSGHTVIQVQPDGQNCIIYFGGTNKTISKRQIDETLSAFDKGDFLLLQNEICNIGYLIDSAYKRGLKIVLNPSPIDASVNLLPLEKIHYFILNEVEGLQLSGETRTERMLPALTKKYPKAKILLTLGSEGAKYYDGKEYYDQAAEKVKVVDTTAAGDTFLGYFVAGIIGGMGVRETLKRAARAAALAVSVKGAAQSIPAYDLVDKTWE